MTQPMGIGKAIRIVRKARGLTQEDFSDISSRTYLSSLERNLKSPTLEKLAQLAVVLQVHPVTLVALSTLATADAGAVEGLLALLDRELKTFTPSAADSA
jgi:transcriptional regulator with XRE-family HTH domain